jgi:hypothetical protein
MYIYLSLRTCSVENILGLYIDLLKSKNMLNVENILSIPILRLRNCLENAQKFYDGGARTS